MKTALALSALALGSTLMSAAATAEDAVGSGTGDGTSAQKHPHDGLAESDLTITDIRINGISGIKFAVPTTVKAFDTIAKKEGRALEQAIAQTLFHGSYGDIRAGVTEALTKQTFTKDGAEVKFAPRLTIGKVEVREVLDDAKKLTGYEAVEGNKKFKADADAKLEPDKAFFDRVCAELGVEGTHFKDLIQQVANENPFDPSRKERTAGARKIAKAYIEAAQGVVDAGEATYQGAASQLAELLDRPVDVSDPETRVMVIATAIADNELREKRERDSALKNKYSSFGA